MGCAWRAPSGALAGSVASENNLDHHALVLRWARIASRIGKDGPVSTAAKFALTKMSRVRDDPSTCLTPMRRLYAGPAGGATRGTSAAAQSASSAPNTSRREGGEILVGLGEPFPYTASDEQSSP
jgi:hypothetical protein